MKWSGSSSAGKITSGIKPHAIPLGIIDFIRQQLPAWRDDPDRSHEVSEPMLNPQLCKFLDVRARNEFPMIAFNHEEPQASGRHADLSASPVESMVIEARSYTKYDPILVIECKRIPAPSKDREKEYVTGAKPDKVSGGIQRFKLGHHGTRLDMVAMIGYVQAGTASHWLDEINGWILELVDNPVGDGCVWDETEILRSIGEDGSKDVFSYRSMHKRIANAASGEIEIHHLWIMMLGDEPARGESA
jgi:hypothetical protein